MFFNICFYISVERRIARYDVSGTDFLDDKLNIMAKQQCFVTIKDHKPDFRTNPKYRLLNPTKSELGKLSKHILQTVNTELRNKIKVKQWQNSSEVIE